MNLELLKSFEEPWILIGIIPILFILIFLIKKDFIKDEIKRKRGRKLYLFLSRLIVYVSLMIALASPFVFDERVVQGDPIVKVLVDNSTSFDVFDKEVASRLQEKLKDYIKVEVDYFGDKEKSAIGDAILDNLKEGESILLISDGNNNHGASFGDVGLYAGNINSSINAIDIKPIKEDYSVKILGPSKVSAGVDSLFTVKISGTKKGTHKVVVTVDGAKVIDTVTDKDRITFSKLFFEGYHDIKAEISENDHFEENNVFYKTVKVIPKPKILYFTNSESPLLNIINKLYEIDVVQSLDNADLSKYYALVINDIPFESLANSLSNIKNYVSDENGLFVVGGINSYDLGNYKDSEIESILPVNIAVAKEKEDQILNIILAIDISGSTEAGFGIGTIADVEKAIAISVIENLKSTHNVGVVAFNNKYYVVSELSPLADKKADLIDKVLKLKRFGNSYIPVGLNKSIDMLLQTPGGRNVIVFSDGRSGGIGNAIAISKVATNNSIKIYGIGVGYDVIPDEELKETGIYGLEYIKKVVEAGNGIYFAGEEVPQKIKILFGSPEEGEKKDNYPLFVLDNNHFITNGLSLSGRVFGFNNVVPKNTGKLLISTDSGEPIVVVWRYGLGRVASLATDDGKKYGGELLDKENSLLITRTLNWVIGDPERKAEHFIDIPDTALNKSTEVKVKSLLEPNAPNVAFYKVGENMYNTFITPDSLGFKSFLNGRYSVNYPEEYFDIGFSDELKNLVDSTNGKIFDENDLEGMINALRAQSKRTVLKKWYYRWPFVLAVLAVFLFEICMRRVIKSRSV